MPRRDPSIQPMPFSQAEQVEIALGKASFPYFVEHIYPLSFAGRTFRMAGGLRQPFGIGAIHRQMAQDIQAFGRTCHLLPRGHLKSTIGNHAHCMWRMFRGSGEAGGDVTGRMFSYNEKLAREHGEKIKQAVESNPYCRWWIDRKPNADSIIEYEVRYDTHPGWLGQVDPWGITSGARGGHPQFVVADDILTDPALGTALDSAVLKRIDHIFESSIEQMPEEDILTVLGTPQTYEDTMFKLRTVAEYHWIRVPAEYQDAAGEWHVAWPEKYDFSRLDRIKRRVVNAYQVEYLLVPWLAVNSYLPREIIELSVVDDLTNWSLAEPFSDPYNRGTYGGMDIGKEVHPTHISIGMKTPTGGIVQIYQQFVDGMPYNEQVALVNKLIRHFGIKRFVYDNTRAEMDDRNMSRRAIGLKFTKKSKAQLALQMEHAFFAVEEEQQRNIALIPDKRQIDQMIGVNKELKSLETTGGHGDSFWSVALMLEAAKQGPVITELGNLQDLFSNQAARRSGYVAPVR